MHFTSIATSFLALATSIQAYDKGFNYGATNADGSCRRYDAFNTMFTRAKQLAGVDVPFTSVRLYTSIQCGSVNAPIEAIKAGLDRGMNLHLGIWASAGQAVVDNEIIAIKQAAAMWPNMMKQRVKSISVGSEDLYRNTEVSKNNGGDPGANGETLVKYIRQLRERLRGTVLEGVPVGHVDTATGWELYGGQQQVLKTVDWAGFNGFPYWEGGSIDQAARLFNEGLAKMEGYAKNARTNWDVKEKVWITEVSKQSEQTGIPHEERLISSIDRLACERPD